MFTTKSLDIPDQNSALPGRDTPIMKPGTHIVLGQPLLDPDPNASECALGMGCFWGAERLFWTLPGVISTAVGYAGGITPNPTYKETCSGKTGHTEVVRIYFDSTQITFAHLLKTFWENHDPTAGMSQGNDVGTQYRSAIFCSNEAQKALAESSLANYQNALLAKGLSKITTTIHTNMPFYYAEENHQQYLAKNPNGYCGIRGTGVSCPIS